MSKKKKGLDLDTQKIVAWCKSNIVLVILIAVCIGAIVGLPQLGAGWTDGVEDSLRQRAKNFTKMESLAKTSVTPPGSNETSNVAVNQALVDEYAEIAESLRGDAEQVVKQATEMNRKNYEVLFTEAPNALFPEADQSKMETLPQQYHKQLETDYQAILESLHAGTAISRADLVTYLEDARVRFMENNLSTKHDSRLTKEQRSSLEKHLSKVRMARLRTNAEDLSVYLDEATLSIPSFDLRVRPTIEVLFAWQWRYWIIADTMGAIASINDGQSVLTTPIKRVVSIQIAGLPALEDEFSGEDEDKGQGSGSPGGGGSGGGGGIGGPPPGGGGSGGGFGGPPGGGYGGPPGGGRGSSGGSNPGGGSNVVENAPDSFTGRASGQMFDVLKVRLRCIVDTERIPAILDGFAKYNFFTVVDLDLWPTDKFEALAEGYDYGPASVSELTLQFESVWFRSWTTEYMPNGVKQILGIKVNE